MLLKMSTKNKDDLPVYLLLLFADFVTHHQQCTKKGIPQILAFNVTKKLLPSEGKIPGPGYPVALLV